MTKPSNIMKNKSGQVIFEEYKTKCNGTYGYHRYDGPACIEYDNENVVSESYYQMGLKHRTDGPARWWYNSDNTYNEQWFLNDELLSPNEIVVLQVNNLLKNRFVISFDKNQLLIRDGVGDFVKATTFKNLQSVLMKLL